MKQLDKDFYMLSAKTAVLFGSDKQSLSTPKTQKDSSDTDKYAVWGDSNLYPQEFTKKLNKTGAAIGGLEVLISAHYGLGFRLYQDVETEEGVTTRERLRSAFPDIDSFFKTCRWDVTMAEIIEDFETYGIAFVEYLLAPNFDKIVSIKRQQAPHCRLGVPNEKGFVDKVYINTTWGSINSMGLPNNGLDYYLDYLLELQESEPNRTFFLSLVGMSPEETHTILKKVQASDFKGITELNLSCPNVPGKPQIAYDFETTEKILSEVFAYFTKPLGIKLPPYFDIVHFDQAAEIFNNYPLKFVNCVNSIGNGLYIEDESVVIRPKNGFGGIGGQYIKPTALANVHAFYQRLKPEIQIIGTGGVLTGRDAFEHILCGASMVQVGTTLHKEGVAAFERITAELKEIMEEKGYESLEDFRGKLKYID